MKKNIFLLAERKTRRFCLLHTNIFLQNQAQTIFNTFWIRAQRVKSKSQVGIWEFTDMKKAVRPIAYSTKKVILRPPDLPDRDLSQSTLPCSSFPYCAFHMNTEVSYRSYSRSIFVFYITKELFRKQFYYCLNVMFWQNRWWILFPFCRCNNNNNLSQK